MFDYASTPEELSLAWRAFLQGMWAASTDNDETHAKVFMPAWKAMSARLDELERAHMARGYEMAKEFSLLKLAQLAKV